MSDERESAEVVLHQPIQTRQVIDLPPMPTQELAAAQQPQLACPELSRALSQARDRCSMAAKDKTNEFHKYKYASADEVISVAKHALEFSGIAIIPQLQELTTVGSGNSAIYCLNRTIFLSHSSGEFVPLSIRGWPVIPERGRPMDKAFAVALTASLAYLLRDLLQMARGDDVDMNNRDDRPAQEPRRQQQRGPTPLQIHAKAIEEAETLDELKACWIAADADKALNANDKRTLAGLKDERKVDLTPPREPGDDPDEQTGKTLFGGKLETQNAAAMR